MADSNQSCATSDVATDDNSGSEKYFVVAN